MTQCAAKRDGQRGEPDTHDQQPEPAAADGDELGRDARLLFRAGRQLFRRLVPQDDQRLHRERHQRGHVAAAPTTATTANTAGSRALQRPTPAPRSYRAGSSATSSSSRSLPGLLKGLSCAANYTHLETHGDFGGAATRAHRRGAGLHSADRQRQPLLALSRDSARACSAITRAITSRSFTAASVGRNQYRRSRTIVNLGLATS